MSFRQLVEPECGGPNPLMQFGNQLLRDVTHKDEGISQRHIAAIESIESGKTFNEDQLVNEFIGQLTLPPQTFQIDALLQEMREIEAHDFQPLVINAPRVIDEVTKNSEWTKEFLCNDDAIKNTSNDIVNEQLPSTAAAAAATTTTESNQFWSPELLETNDVDPLQQKMIFLRTFFDENEDEVNENVTDSNGVSGQIIQHHQLPPRSVFENIINYDNSFETVNKSPVTNDVYMSEKWLDDTSSDWLEDFSKNNAEEAKKTTEYNQRFWQNLQDEWKKISEDSNLVYPWLSEFTDYYDPYKEYLFIEENPMANDVNALEKGKEFLARSDIPNAVLCFESAAKQDPQNAEAWELLGISQAENEMDPHAIAALKKSLELKPNNMKVLMALAISYTNESLQSQALKMLVSWIQWNPKYAHLVQDKLLKDNETASAGSLIRGPELREIQNLFLEAVKQNPNEVDSDIQEALGVLFTLSSEYDKAVDCFRAALQIRPDNAKVWNRLGASLANGNRTVEAVEAYQRALEISPGFIRARYNVGIVCMNLKAYKQAAEHLLTALNLQATSTVRSGLASSCPQMSDTIWSTLKMVVSLTGRWDLQEALDTKNLEALNKVFNDSSESEGQ